MTALVVLLGACVGVGLCVIVAAALPRPTPLRKVLAVVAAAPSPLAGLSSDTPAGWTDQSVGPVARLGRPAVRLLHAVGLPTAATRTDLAALDRPTAVHLAEQAGAAIVGLVIPVVASGLLAAGGITLAVPGPAAASLVLAAAGFAAPTWKVRTDAARLRADARHAVASFLGLVVVSISGGAGVDQALHDAAALGAGPVFRDIGYALEHARLARIPAWDTLAALGARLGVEPLQHLAATVGLAGSEGAKVRESLRARAQAVRDRQRAAVEAAASAATERMSIPVVALFAGYLVFLGYPAVAAVTGSL